MTYEALQAHDDPAGDTRSGASESSTGLGNYARLARALTGCEVTLVGFLDGDRLRLAGSSGLPRESSSEQVPEAGPGADGLPFPSPALADAVRARGLCLSSDTTLGKHPWDSAVADRGWRSYAVVPVRDARGDAAAVICVLDHEARAWDPSVLGELGDLAEACAAEVNLRREREEAVAARLAAERSEARTAALLADRSSVAHALQVAMLTDLPTVEGLHLDAVYAPASDTEEVGGDWYDAMVLADGGCALVVGDITGKGIESAAIMGQTRSMLRALWWEHDKPPSAIISLLDNASLGTGLCATGTALLARVEPPGPSPVRRVSWSSAGHPLPVVARADGSVDIPGGRPDPLLGFVPGAARVDRTLDLAPGDTLLMVTDGLVERRGELLPKSLNRLAAAIRDGVRTPQDLLERLAPRQVREDDVVVLSVSAASS